MDFLPDYIQTKVQTPDYFFINLPVTAFGIADPSMIMEISVDYVLSPDKRGYEANVWSRQKGAKIKHFIYHISLTMSSGPILEILEAINSDETFMQLMVAYICEAAKHRVDL